MRIPSTISSVASETSSCCEGSDSVVFSTRSAILKDPSITERQKQALIDHYRSYVESNAPTERAASIVDVTKER